MKQKHTLITLILAAVLTVLFGIGYSILIIPNEKQAKKYDTNRERQFASISAEITKYQASKKELPKSLSTLADEVVSNSGSSSTESSNILDSFVSSISGSMIRDPQTNKPFGYEYDSQDSKEYKLCVQFAYSNEGDKEVSSTSSLNAPSTSVSHGKGQQCVTFKIKEQTKTKSLNDMTNDEYLDYLDNLRDSTNKNSGSSSNSSSKSSSSSF